MYTQKGKGAISPSSSSTVHAAIAIRSWLIFIIISVAALAAHYFVAGDLSFIGGQVVVYLVKVTAARFSCICRCWIKWQVESGFVFVHIRRAREIIDGQ
jgi:hypothetical protein